MAKNRWRRWWAIGILSMLVFGMTAGVVSAQGPVSITAKIYKSDGTEVTSEFDGIPATVIVIDKDTGEETTYDAHLESGWVIAAVSEDAISPGDRVRIKIDASAWNDADYFVHAKGDPDTIDFMYSGPPSVSIQAQTYKNAPMNLKPMIALVFIILILLFGFLLLAVLNRQKVNVVITGKEWVRMQTKQGLKETWKYSCAYGEPGYLTELGDFNDDKDYPESSILKIFVRKIIKKPAGNYGWYNPKPVDISKLSQNRLPTRLDSEEKIDNRWFQGGALKLEKGETMKHASRRHTHVLFAAFVYPFLILEVILGAGALFYESLHFPPSIWILIINIIILVLAIIFQASSCAKATKEEKPPEPVTPGAPPSPISVVPPLKSELETMEEPVAPIPPPTPPPYAPEGPSKPPAEKIACSNCGQEVEPDYVICPFCGQEL